MTVGGTTSGYSLMGSWRREIAPTRKITIERTPAKIGRLMKKSEIFMGKAVARVVRKRMIRLSWPASPETGRRGDVERDPCSREQGYKAISGSRFWWWSLTGPRFASWRLAPAR